MIAEKLLAGEGVNAGIAPPCPCHFLAPGHRGLPRSGSPPTRPNPGTREKPLREFPCSLWFPPVPRVTREDPEGTHCVCSTPAPAASLWDGACLASHSFSTNQLWPQNPGLRLKKPSQMGHCSKPGIFHAHPDPPKQGTASGTPRQDFSSEAGGLPAPAPLHPPLHPPLSARRGLPRHRPVVLSPRSAAGVPPGL